MKRRYLTAVCAWAAITLLGGAGAAWASSHAEAPGTAKDRLADDTDLWAWVAPDAPNAVTLLGGWVPLLEPAAGPNFYSFDDDAFYYVNIDNVGDAKDHIRYEFKFTTERRTSDTFLYNTGVVNSLDDPNLNVRQFYKLTRIDDGVETVLIDHAPVAPQNVGPKSMPNYPTLAQAAVQTLSDGTKVFVGPRDDPFFVDLSSIFDLLTIRRIPGDRGKGVDDLAGFNVMIIALQVPKNELTAGSRPGVPVAVTPDNSVIGIYDSTQRPTTRTLNADGTVSFSGDEVQVSRLGQPLINEVIIPLKDKDKFNATKPTGDGAFASYVVDPELPKLFNALYGIPIPTTPRNDLVTVFLTGIPGLNKPSNPNQVACEMLRLNMSVPPAATPNRLGVLGGDIAGFPNGRRLTDDVVDIEERAAAGGYALTPSFNTAPANELGDGVDANDVPLLPYFPYAALPHNPFSHEHHIEQKAPSPSPKQVSIGPMGAGGALSLAGTQPAKTSTLSYTMAKPGHVTLKIYDAAGRELRTLVDQDAAAGTFRALWDGRDDTGSLVGHGVFFARFVATGMPTETRKIVLE
jgi:hypothetical protein